MTTIACEICQITEQGGKEGCRFSWHEATECIKGRFQGSWELPQGQRQPTWRVLLPISLQLGKSNRKHKPDQKRTTPHPKSKPSSSYVLAVKISCTHMSAKILKNQVKTKMQGFLTTTLW